MYTGIVERTPIGQCGCAHVPSMNQACSESEPEQLAVVAPDKTLGTIYNTKSFPVLFGKKYLPV